MRARLASLAPAKLLIALALCLFGGISTRAQSGNPNQLNFFFRQKIGVNSYQDESAILFLAGASRGRDAFDANNLAGANIDGASVPVPGLELAINVMPDFTQREAIPVTFNASTGQARIVVMGFSSFPIGTKFYLRDSLLHQTIQLGLTGTGTIADSTVYPFSVTASPASEGLRFTLIFEPASGPLPCPAAPAANEAAVTRCGTGRSSVGVSSIPNGCTPQWYLASSGTSGAPLGTGATFSPNLALSDTILVRYSCAGACSTSFTKIPVTVEMSAFNIRLNPASAAPGATVRILGSLLNLADRVTLSGLNMAFQRVSNSELTFVLPQGPPSGLVKVIDDGDASCPDSAAFTVLPGNCLPPTPVAATTNYCGTSLIQVQLDSVTPGCTVRWYLASRGTAGVPLATTPTLQTVLRTSDTLLVQKLCGTSCVSGFAKLPITISQTPFRIRLAPDSGRIGDLVRIRGLRLRSAASVQFNNEPLTVQGSADTLLTFRIPPNAQSGYVKVLGPGLCPDSALLRIVRPCNAPVSHTVSGLVPCGPQSVTVTVDSVAGTGCYMQWYLASASGIILSTDSVLNVPIPATDTILVRRYCNASCVSAFTRIPVVVHASPFDITLTSDAGRPGDTITVRGSTLDKANRITLAGTPSSIQSRSDTALRFIVPAGARTGSLVIADSLGVFCPDSAFFTVLPAAVDTCLSHPRVIPNFVSLCTAGQVMFRIQNSGGCEVEWYLASRGTAGAPFATGTRLTYDALSSDTLLMRRVCDTNCVSRFLRIPVLVSQNPFHIRLAPDSGRSGDTITIIGTMLDSVEKGYLNGQGIALQTRTDTALTVIVPPGLPFGALWFKVASRVACSDSVLFTHLQPVRVRPRLQGAAFKAKPNPAHDAFTVSLAAPANGPVLVQLVDLSGRIVASQKAAGQPDAVTVRLKGIMPGLYHLRVHMPGQVQIGKMVVE